MFKVVVLQFNYSVFKVVVLCFIFHSFFKETTYNFYNLPNVHQAAFECGEVDFLKKISGWLGVV